MSKALRIIAPLLVIGGVGPATAQEPLQADLSDRIVETSVELGPAESVLRLELDDGSDLTIRFADERIYIDGVEAASYEADGQLEAEWREFLRAATGGDAVDAWNRFDESALDGADPQVARSIRDAFAAIATGASAAAAVAPGADEAAPAQAEGTEAADVAEGAQGSTAAREIVRGGLVVELSELDGTTRALKRLWPELPVQVDRALEGPIKIVIDADEYRLPEGVGLDRSLLLVESDGVVGGSVAGNLIVADADLTLESTARVEGDLIALDATVENLGGTIVGSLRHIDDPRIVQVEPPARVEEVDRGSSLLDNVVGGMGSLLQTVAAYLIFGFLGALVVYFFRGHLETVSDTVSVSFGRSFLAGLAAEVLFFPVLLVLTVLVLTWIVIPFYVVGAGLAVLLGYLAVAHAAGENLTRRRYPSWAARLRRSNSYYYVLNGLGVLLALFAGAAVAEMGGALLDWAYGLLMAAALILTWIAMTAGLGGVLLSRAGTRRSYARPRELPETSLESYSRPGRGYRPRTGSRRSQGGTTGDDAI